MCNGIGGLGLRNRVQWVQSWGVGGAELSLALSTLYGAVSIPSEGGDTHRDAIITTTICTSVVTISIMTTLIVNMSYSLNS